ncbi:MAG: YciI family protein [Thermoplasmata archaeon]
MAYFIVINQQGPAWAPSRPMRDQEKWKEHAAFVNELVREGFVVIAGPLGDGSIHRALLVLHADSEATIRARFNEDPWIREGILQTVKIDPWEILASDDRLDAVLADITHGNPQG